jgi:hypothetical protein
VNLQADRCHESSSSSSSSSSIASRTTTRTIAVRIGGKTKISSHFFVSESFSALVSPRGERSGESRDDRDRKGRQAALWGRPVQEASTAPAEKLDRRRRGQHALRRPGKHAVEGRREEKEGEICAA